MRRWYVATTYSGFENSVKQDLERRMESMNMTDKIYQVLVPEEIEEVGQILLLIKRQEEIIATKKKKKIGQIQFSLCKDLSVIIYFLLIIHSTDIY